MSFPYTRLRRLRMNPALRDLVRETSLSVDDFIMPMFIVPGSGVKKEISSLQGQYHFSVDTCGEQAKKWYDLGIKSVLLFGVPESKDETGSVALQKNGIIQRSLEALKKAAPQMMLTTDLCFCEYTSHGHCGIMKDGELDNDSTLEMLQAQAVSHAQAGAGLIAPSGMLDGMVSAIRRGLDQNGFQNIPIMSYAAKFASAFYGPFREAVGSAPSYGDRRSYQMDPANARQAMREVALDVEEGADIIMVKPALAFLDIIKSVKDSYNHPIAAYNVSGEYAMVKAASEKGWIDGERVMLESLLSIKRAGADIIISYFTEEFARLKTRKDI